MYVCRFLEIQLHHGPVTDIVNVWGLFADVLEYSTQLWTNEGIQHNTREEAQNIFESVYRELPRERSLILELALPAFNNSDPYSRAIFWMDCTRQLNTLR